MLKRIAACGVIAFCGAASSAFADIYNANTDFPTKITSITPAVSMNGVWDYGFSPQLTPSVVSLDTGATSDYFTDGNADGFYQAPGVTLPTVLQNISGGNLPTERTITNWPNTLLLLHPGPTGNNSVVQFIAPSTGTYTISGEFIAMDSGETTDSILSPTGATLFTTDSSKTAASFYLSESLTKGQTIDFVVGLGPQGQFNNDSTGFNAVITPEPGFYGILALGLAGLAFAVIRQRSVSGEIK